MTSIGLIALKLRHYKLLYILLNYLFDMLQYITRLLFIACWINKIDQNKIVINNHGRGYNDHAKYIVEEMNKKGKNYDIVWLVNDDSSRGEFPDNVRLVNLSDFKAIYELATAKIWIDNAEKRLSALKRNGQYFIQTWHGFGPKKVVVNDSFMGHEVRLLIKHNAKIIDLYLSNNQLLSQIYHSDFKYNGDILCKGFPRNDIFFKSNSDDIIKKVTSAFSLSKEQHIVLYAPTYREDNDLTTYNIDFENILTSLKNRYGGEWVFLLRLHPVIAALSKEFCANNPSIIDASRYLDMQELLLASDILITDYSSCMFDFALTKRPCILYHPDVNEYNDVRGFCIQPEDLPFPRAHSVAELLKTIEDFDQEKYERILNECFERYHMVDNGTASCAVIEWIDQKINS